ncbi:MAG: UDP-N-acetylmuramoyl-L-alanyl-D-glutamate--2,6-diaminopimelate ligase, partial [Firmicutes bacterium]|nr:UDP-N-acetylmuramoyl-L-alanyl-D-glutamate--2,6-diaminopimelate ligase [Bacillota bacterium]
MDLKTLLEPLLIKKIEGEAGGKVSGLASHSKKVEPGTLYFALAGRHSEGWRYAAEAFARGALAAVVDEGCPLRGSPLVRVPAVRPALALLANRFYRYPSRQYRLIGVTGTNGKTTTAHLIDALFRARGEVTGLLGTVGNYLGEKYRKAAATTPEAHELQKMLAQLSAMGAAHVTMEVSSHALALDRVLGCSFDLA